LLHGQHQRIQRYEVFHFMRFSTFFYS
jgi:hypothetical protein